MMAAALDPMPRASGISLSIVIRNPGSGRFRADATLLATRKIKLSLVVGIDAASIPLAMISKSGHSPPRRGGVARSAGVVSSANIFPELTTPSALSARWLSAHPPLLCEEGNGSISRVTLKYLFNARLKASKPAPKLDVLAGTRNEWLRLITILFSLRKFLRGRDDRSKFRIAGPPVPETSSC